MIFWKKVSLRRAWLSCWERQYWQFLKIFVCMLDLEIGCITFVRNQLVLLFTSFMYENFILFITSIIERWLHLAERLSCPFSCTSNQSIPTELRTSLLHIWQILAKIQVYMQTSSSSVISLSLLTTRSSCRVLKQTTIDLLLSSFRPLTKGSLQMNITGRSIFVFLCYYYATTYGFLGNDLQFLKRFYFFGFYDLSLEPFGCFPYPFSFLGASLIIPVSKQFKTSFMPFESLSKAPSTSSMMMQVGFFQALRVWLLARLSILEMSAFADRSSEALISSQ